MVELPDSACDCHTHIFGPYDRFPLPDERTYTPLEATVADLRAVHADLGLHRVVLVQPSPYGPDNACMVDALRELGPAGRGVAVIDPATTSAELDELAGAGVRGVRVNLHSHGIDDPAEARERLRATAERVEPLGWHLQVFATNDLLATLGDELGTLPVPLVVDHFGFARPDAGVDQPGFGLVRELVGSGVAWVKISGPDRLTSDPDQPAVTELARALVAANPDHVVWGSDWPHTRSGGDPRTPQPFGPVDDRRNLARLREWLADDATFRRVLVDNPARLYDFGQAAGSA